MNKLSLEQVEWKEFLIGGKDGIFSISSSNSGIDKSKLIEVIGKIPYITRSEVNNGVNLFVGKEQSKKYSLNKGNVITIGLDTQTVFYQPHFFYTGQNIQILEHKNITKYIALFIIPLLKIQMRKFNWGGNGATLTRLKRTKILLPIDSLGNPNWKFMEDYMRQQEEKLLKSLKNKLKKKNVLNSEKIKPLSECDWREFFIEDITEILSGKDIYEKERVCGDTPYITSTANNNGIGYFVDNINLTLEENCVSVNRNGSVGYAFYHPYIALYSNDTRKLRPKINDPYFAIFLSNMITLQKDKYGYGYKMGTARLKRQKIMLPVNSNNKPDFEYMSNYMKKIESEKIKTYFQKKKLSY
ncbi:hypothetical protein BHC46_08370 [Snodgrassella alvi]|uniref:Type I restriction modification DNA specificity domain-containing protein n=1 Tax=Snodgrassella alvi TaxID=1196083 RepID=A0A2N9XF47_9NEIS|nr:restriction endonuclease subunit S [Snodgrassella alvi]PIT46235.1 hypothetical protein BHC46_08370 [Snodgrassella alvi]